MPAMTVREVTLDLLRSLGMTAIFGNPGSTELPLYRYFPSDFRYILGLQESVCLAMADGYAQATRNAAFVNLHSAAGLGHALGNLFTAFRNQTALVVTAGQQARSILPYAPFLFAERAAEFPRPYVKWSSEPARAEDVPVAIAQAYRIAMQPPCGPTFVSIPVDDWDRLASPVPPMRMGQLLRGDPELLADARVALNTAKHPKIVVGAGIARDDAWHEVIALAERHEAPVWVAPMSARNGFPEHHRLFAGFLAADREAIVQTLDGGDLILVLGGVLGRYHVEGFGDHIPSGARQIQLSDNPTEAACTPVGTVIVTNLKLGIEDLLAGPAPVARAAPRVTRPIRALSPELLSDAWLMSRIAALRPPGSVIVEEAPGSRGVMHDYLPIQDRDGFYTCASGGLGHGLPASVGVSLGRPGTKVIALLGDGSSMYAIQGLWSAAQLGTPVSFVIIKNRRYAALAHFGRHFTMDRLVGIDLPGLDFCALAQGQGLRAVRVNTIQDLDAALSESFAAKVPTLLEVEVV